MTALSMIETVFEATPLRRSGIAFLTKTRPGTADILRYGSRYVDLPKAETISVLEDLSPPLGSIMTGARPTPMDSSDLHLVHSTVDYLFQMESTCELKFVPKL
jgi:hypothetical protein